MFSQTDASCSADVLKKLKVWLKHRAPGEKDMVDLTPEDLIIVSVIRDLERMCDSASQNFEKIV
jgi:hypothetical protein